MLAPLVGLPKQSEVLIIILMGICFLSLDFSLLDLQEDLKKIWNLQLQKSKNLEIPLKYVIAAIVLTRTFTLHLFLAFYVVMLWPAIFEDKSSLMLPWLFLGILRCFILNLVTFLIGSFICQKEKGFSPLCFDFILAQIIEHGPSIYAWMAILSFYKKISRTSNIIISQEDQKKLSEKFVLKIKSHSYSEGLNEELKFIPEVSKSFDAIIQEKISHLECSRSNLTITEKLMDFLKITTEDIKKAAEIKDKFAQLLLDISLKDVEQISLSRKSYYFDSFDQKESNQTLLECEIDNISLNDINREDNNSSMGFNASNFLQNFVIKKNTSKSFGCQVTMLKKGFFEKSKNQLVKKLMFLKNFGLY